MRVHETIRQQVNAHAIGLHMKGTPQFPQCRFSGSAALRLKAYSNWPPIPQPYVKGELIGSADISREPYLTGELEPLPDAAAARAE